MKEIQKIICKNCKETFILSNILPDDYINKTLCPKCESQKELKGGKKEMTQPKQKIRYKNVVLSVFENTTNNNETYESVSIQKFYYDQNEQQWKHTTNFNENDLLKVQVVINSYYFNKTE